MENPFELLDQRLSDIEDKLENLIQRIDNQKNSSVLDPTCVTTKQLAQHHGISTAAITNLRGSKIPFYKIGGRILFKREEVDAYIQKSRYMSGRDNLDEYFKRGSTFYFKRKDLQNLNKELKKRNINLETYSDLLQDKEKFRKYCQYL